MMTVDMFDAFEEPGQQQRLGERAVVLRGFALPYVGALLSDMEAVVRVAPWRHMVTPGGHPMSVALTNCGALGWVSDRHGYRYTPFDPLAQDAGGVARHWPAIPQPFLELAHTAAAAAGFEQFAPDACLINHYVPGARMGLHQDKDERDLTAPIVSISLGIPAVFLFGGHARSDKTQKIPLFHGDIAIWGGPDRLRYHGILPLKAANHPLLGAQRINITFRKVR